MGHEVKLTLRDSFRTEVTSGRHMFVLDEPVEAGGNDDGPTPYDMLAAALGGCTAMTLHFYAKRENIPLDGVETHVAHDRKHAKDCADCVTEDGFVHRFTLKLRLLGDLTDVQRQKLADVAHRCPVARTLMNEIKIDHVVID